MPNQEVHRVEDVNLNLNDLEMQNTSREIQFNVKGKVLHLTYH